MRGNLRFFFLGDYCDLHQAGLIAKWPNLRHISDFIPPIVPTICRPIEAVSPACKSRFRQRNQICHCAPPAWDSSQHSKSSDYRSLASLRGLALQKQARSLCDRRQLSDAWSNFISNRSMTSGAPFGVRMRPGHSSRNEPNQPAQRQQKFRSDRFACFERSSFC